MLKATMERLLPVPTLLAGCRREWDGAYKPLVAFAVVARDERDPGGVGGAGAPGSRSVKRTSLPGTVLKWDEIIASTLVLEIHRA